MKKIEAIIRRSKYRVVKEALHEKGITFFSYWDVVTFKYCFCGRKTKKYKAYVQHINTIKERMDIRSMITSTANVNVLSNVLMEPYQMKLIANLKK